MAYAFQRKQEHKIRCNECGIESAYNLIDYEDQVQVYLHENINILDIFGRPDESEFDPIIEEVPITVTCIVCDTDINIDVKVGAEAELSDFMESDADPRIECFEITWYGVISPEDHLNENCELIGFDRHNSNREVDLRMICKTRMNLGYCYMGYDANGERLLRPISRTQSGKCCWPTRTEFEIGGLYTFNVLHHPDNRSRKLQHTTFPHRHDDLVVSENATKCASRESWSPRLLEAIARENICDIFPGHLIIENKYVDENTECPSVGVLKTSEEHLDVFENDFGKTRLSVSLPHEVYDFPVTGLEFDKPTVNGKRDALVLLGLGRPYAGPEDNVFDPARCYILVLGIFLY